MPWDTLDESSPLFLLYQKAITLRKKEAVLRRGEYRTLLAEPGSRVYGYERYLEKEDGSIESIRIYLNMEEEYVPLPEELPGGEILWQEGLKEGQLAAKGFALIRARD